jgi:hypothetical protein
MFITDCGVLMNVFQQGLMSELQPFIETANPQRGPALVLLGNVAVAMERKLSASYLSLGLEAAWAVVSDTTSSIIEKESAVCFVSCYIRVMKSDFITHLPSWIPVISSLLRLPDISRHLPMSVHTTLLKQAVLSNILYIAKHTGIELESHALDLWELLNEVNFSENSLHHEFSFRANVELLSLLLKSGQDLKCFKAHHIDKMVVLSVQVFLKVLLMEKSEEVASVGAKALTSLVKLVGNRLLKTVPDMNQNDITLDPTMTLLAKAALLRGLPCQQSKLRPRENLGSDNDTTTVDSGEGIGGGNRGVSFAEGDVDTMQDEDLTGEVWGGSYILDSVFDLITEMASAMKLKFIIHFADLNHLIFGFTDRKHNYAVRAKAICCLATTAERIGPIMFQNSGFADSFLRVLKQSINDKSQLVRRYSAYGLSVVIRYLSPSSLAFHAPTFFEWISPLCHHCIPAGRTNMGGADVDYILTALARLVERCDSEEVPRLTSLSMLLEALPLREEFAEGLVIYTILVNLVKSGDAAILMLMPQLLGSFAHVLDVKSQYSEETKALARSCLQDHIAPPHLGLRLLLAADTEQGDQ